MANPNLVRKVSDNPTGGAGEITPASIFTISDKLQNVIINGDMRISQRGNSFPSAANNSYYLDRWRYQKTGAMVHTISVDTDVPTLAQAGQLFTASQRLLLTTPDDSIAATDSLRIEQTIEGYHFQKIAQKQFTVSFWVKATLPGTYSIQLRNTDASLSMVKQYTITNSSTWEYKTIVCAATPSAGTWNYDVGAGQVNGTQTGAIDFRFTGLMINEGATAAPFSLFAKNWAGEYAACQRYYEITPVHGLSDGSNGAIINITGPFCAAKRAIPICSSIGTIAHINGGGGAFTFVGSSSSSPNGLYVVINNGAALSNNFHFRGIAEASAEF